MKRLLTIGLLLAATALPLGAWGQNHQERVTDSAVFVVDRFLRMQNIDGLPADSLLVMETAVTYYGQEDTIWMRRWYAKDNCFRVEVWNQGKLETGLVGNGKDRFRRYLVSSDSWESLSADKFYSKLWGFDFRGPLYDWRVKQAKLTWKGSTELKGHRLQVVMVEMPTMFTRYYMFEPNSGLLTLIIETEESLEEIAKPRDGHTEWKSVHEYMPVGVSLLPSLESFMRSKTLTIMSTKIHFEPLDKTLFEHD